MIEGGVGISPNIFLIMFKQNGASLGTSNRYMCLDIMPQEGSLPIWKYFNKDIQYIDICPMIHCMCRNSK